MPVVKKQHRVEHLAALIKAYPIRFAAGVVILGFSHGFRNLVFAMARAGPTWATWS